MSTFRNFFIWLLASYFLLTGCNDLGKSTEMPLEERMEWFEDARFGMFLHWGVYSTFGGEWDGVDHGKEMGEASAEWIYLRADIPQSDYEAAAMSFNPVKYDPEEWVRIAKDAGMKYMVLTSKHHDGFALFETEASAWNIMESSIYSKDLIRGYIDECHKQGMRVGLYYSHEKDWYHHKKVQRDTSAISSEYKNIVRTHLTELLSNYGKIDLIWFDMGISQHKELNQMCYDLVRKFQPACIISSRIGNSLGDYRNLRDRELALPGTEGYVESIMTLRLNWGYDHNDINWKDSHEVIEMLSKCACRNSNFLLNIGPKPDGSFTDQEKQRLKEIGEWMNIHGDAIYGTSGSPFKGEYDWGSITSKENKVYLHLFELESDSIELSGINSLVKYAYLLEGEIPVQLYQTENLLELTMPIEAKGQVLPIVVLEIDNNLSVDIDLGPTRIPPAVHHVNRISINGTVKSIKGDYFTLSSGKSEILFTMKDLPEFRISKNGIIQRVEDIVLIVGAEYNIIYTPGELNRLEIVTLHQ